MTVLALLLVLLAVPAGDAPTEKGTLCVLRKNDQQCTAAEGMTLPVVAAETSRAFVWASADGSRLLLGTIAAKASTVSIDEKSRSNIALAIAGDRRRGWPLDARLTFSTKEQDWVFPLSTKVVAKLRSVRLPPASYLMTIAAEHHLIAKRTLNAKKDVALGEIALKPLPLISGRVVNMKDEPIAGAQLVLTDGKIQTTTNEQGQFRTELAEPIPGEVLVTQAHFASALLPLVNVSGEIDLGTIHLGTGFKLTLRLVRPDVENLPLHVRLLRETPQRNEPSPIAQRDLPGKDDQISFPDLSAGKYVVVIEGNEPLQRLSKEFEIKDADREEEIHIAPFRLDGSVHIGDEPLRGGGNLDLFDPTQSWRINLSIDDAGRFGGSMWQGGTVAGFVTAAGIHELVDSPTLGADPSPWDIQFHRRYIRGRIFDEETNQPVQQPSLRLQITSGDSPSNSTLPIDPDGRYSILAVRAGTYELRAEAPDHVPANATVSVATEDSTDRQADFALARGFQQVVEFVWPSGQAVADAPVLDGIASDGYNAERTYTTDGTGRLTLKLRRGEVKTIYILPRDGSFAIAHVVAPESSDASPLRVIVPVPGGALRSEMRDADDKPLPAMLIFRFNGELIPQPVILHLTGQYENASMLRVPNLPAGAYEIWAVPVVNYAFAPLAGRVPSRAPLRVGLTVGEQSITVVAGPLN
ncbi:MAG TPA: carboxypeptidase-like regulatory domain-containing protein [Thermoanaerobaculia bacterium]